MTTAVTPQQQQCEEYVTAHFKPYADSMFPDNTHNTWKIVGFEHDGNKTFVEARPTPDDVGYPSFKFVFRYDYEDDVSCLGVYCLKGGTYTLLCCDPDWQAKAPKKL